MVDSTHGITHRGSQIFSPYIAVGFYSNHVPCEYQVKGADHFLVTAVGTSFHLYNCNKLSRCVVGKPLPQEISALCAFSNDDIIVAAGTNIYTFTKGKQVSTFSEHKAKVFLLVKLAEHLISVDNQNEVKVWSVKDTELYLDFTPDIDEFTITTCMHPATYLNKILLGSKQGKMQLWNVKTHSLIHEFKGWKEPILVLEQAPAVDVVAVGLQSGHIVLFNIKYEKKLMSFYQEYGILTAISFRTDGSPIMATAGSTGYISLWDLEKRQNITTIRNAHSSSVTGLNFVFKQPMLMSTGPDNAIKVWVFDNPDGSGRLLRSRSGHNAPPTRTVFFGESGKLLLSAGLDNTLRFNKIHRGETVEFTQGHVVKAASKKGTTVEKLKLPAITCMAVERVREFDWDSIVTCHMGMSSAITWTTNSKSQGKHRFSSGSKGKATACEISSCGNFAVIGYSDGLLKKFNMQSGLDRGHFGAKSDENGHCGPVRGVSVDNINATMISTSADKTIKCWNFNNMKLMDTIKCECPIAQSKLHRESSLLAVSFDDFKINIYDIDTKAVVRTFYGHSGVITDITWSSDARWLISCSMDATIKTWDVPSARLVDCFGVDEPATSVSFSPQRDMLVTTHQDNKGLYLWSNKSLFSGINPSPLPDDYTPITVDLPSSKGEKKGIDTDSESEEEMETNGHDEMEPIKEYVSPEQLKESLVTLSMLPESRWRNLVNLDLIKMRNKPKEPPKKPEAAPFFLPTVTGLESKFDLTKEKKEDNEDESKNKMLIRKSFDSDSPIKKLIEKDVENIQLLHFLKDLNPSELETEFRLLSPDLGGDVNSLCRLMDAFAYLLKTSKDYELTQAFISLFLKLYGDIIPTHDNMREASERLLHTIKDSWKECEELMFQSTCLIKYFKSATV